MNDWLPIARYFEAEYYPAALLVDGVEVAGYWDDDSGCWFHEGEGCDIESAPIQPTHFRPSAE